MVPAYKQLEAKTRIADLTLGQWVGVVAGMLCALVVIAWLGENMNAIPARGETYVLPIIRKGRRHPADEFPRGEWVDRCVRSGRAARADLEGDDVAVGCEEVLQSGVAGGDEDPCGHFGELV